MNPFLREDINKYIEKYYKSIHTRKYNSILAVLVNRTSPIRVFLDAYIENGNPLGDGKQWRDHMEVEVYTINVEPQETYTFWSLGVYFRNNDIVNKIKRNYVRDILERFKYQGQ